MPDGRERGLLGPLDLAVQRGRHVGQVVGVGGDAGAFHPGQHVDQGQLDVVQQGARAAPFQVGVEAVGQFGGGPGVQHQVGRGVLLPRSVQRELLRGAGVVAQFLAQVAQGQVAQVERALAGQGQVGGQRGVAGQPVQLEAVGGEGVHRALGVVHGLGQARRGQPAAERLAVGLGQRGRVEVGAVAVGGGDGDPGQRAGAAAPGTGHRQPGPGDGGRVVRGLGRVVGDPLGHLVRAEQGDLDLESGGGLGGLVVGGGDPADAVGQGLVEPVTQHPELQRVEQLVDLVAIPDPGDEVVRGGADVAQRDVPDQRGHLPVTQHVAQVLAERVTRLALDLVDPVDQLFQRAELADPLGRGLLPHPRDTGQVVAGVAAHRGEVRVLGRGEGVLLLDRGRGEAGHVGNAAAGHQHGHVVVDELEHVTVAADDEHVHALGLGLGGQRGDQSSAS